MPDTTPKEEKPLDKKEQKPTYDPSELRYYTFQYAGAIPGIPGEFYAGQRVTIHEPTNTIISIEVGV